MLAFNLFLLYSVGDGMVLELAFAHLHFAEFAGHYVRVLHRNAAELDVFVHEADREFLKAERALAHLLLAEVRDVLLVG